jgi:HK97 gp10 family phage protein
VAKSSLKSNFGRIAADLSRAAARGNHRAAGFVADLAAQLAPVDTGGLRASIRVETGPDEPTQVVTAGRGLPDIRAVAQEYGTVTAPSQPFMTPAARAVRPAKEIAAEVEALVRSNAV